MTIESEEFYNLMQAYRHAQGNAAVCEKYQAVIAHVDDEIAALHVKLEEAEMDAERYIAIAASVNLRGFCMPMYEMTEEHKAALDERCDAIRVLSKGKTEK